MKPLIYITQLPEYKRQLERQLHLLEVAPGFTDTQKAKLVAGHKELLASVNEILGTTETTQTETH